MRTKRTRAAALPWKRVVRLSALGVGLGGMMALAEPGGTTVTPTVPLELPVEIETELAPAGSLKQAPLWKELEQLLDNPYAPPVRRRSFTFEGGAEVPLPPLNVYPLDKNVPTGQLLRLRTSDGEISWDQPGPLFGPDDGDPDTLLPIIGELVDEEGNLVVRNVASGADLPPDGTIVAVPAVLDGVLHELDPETGEREPVDSLEKPISESDFFRRLDDARGLGSPLATQPVRGRTAAELLGKALFWDMQVGSDGVQACGTCHFSAGVDNRTRNQLNPDHLGNDLTFQVKQPNEAVVASDFPFHKLANPDVPGEPLFNPANVVSDANDVMSSMGVIFRRFVDIPAIGSFGPAVSGVSPVLPDVGIADPDPIPGFQGLRRVEGRHTPTMHSAAFNHDNFWDGRARFHFNGGSSAGIADPFFHVYLNDSGRLVGATNGHFREDLAEENPVAAAQPVRILFSSLGSQAVEPPLSAFEMSFVGRNWAKIGKKLLQSGVTPLANQLVATTDSLLGPYSNQGGTQCSSLPGRRPTASGKPGLCIRYDELIRLAFPPEFWGNERQHLNGTPAPCTSAVNGVLTPATCDPFDGYTLTVAPGPAARTNTNQFTQAEANFSLFFGLGVQAYEQLLIPDDSPFDRFMDANPLAANGVGQPGEQGTLPPERVRQLVGGQLNLVPGFGPDELFGFDIFAGANLTAALPTGTPRNRDGIGSNPFIRTARCMLCHFGPEQSDHTISVNHGLLLSDTEFELPPPGEPEPTGPFAVVPGFMLAEEVEEAAQDGVEVENRNFVVVDDPTTPWDDRQIGVPTGIAFQDNGIYNVGVRPTAEDLGRGANDPYGWPISLAALALKNLGGPDYEACDTPGDTCTGPLANYDPELGLGGGLFEETGADQRINPGLEVEPVEPLMPPHMAHWLNNLPAGELHPQVDELAFVPNTVTEPPAAEFGEIQFGSDLHCGTYDPVQFPENGWGPRCPNTQSAIPNNYDPALNGTWPIPNRVARNGAFKAPQLRNVELTGPYFHTGSYLTLRQVVDFYIRGGDFPATNAEDRDPNMVDVTQQAFGFGTTIGLPPQFQDGVPDVISQYPTLEAAIQEDAKQALVKFLFTLTDARVKFERAPFDRPEIFVPEDGTAPDNTGGRSALLADPRFRRLAEVGAEGRADPVPNFLDVASTPRDGPNNDHFDR